MQEQDYNKVNYTESEKLTPSPVEPPPPASIENVLQMYDQYYKETNKQYHKSYKSGVMLGESLSDDLHEILNTLITVVCYGYATSTEDIASLRSVTCMLNCTEEMMKTIDFKQADITDVKSIIVKLLGVITKLHKNIDSYKI